MSGYSGTPLAQKLGIRAGSRIFLSAAPADYDRLIAPVPAGVCRVARLDAATDLIHIFATRRSMLAQALTAALKTMRPDATIWVSWPKKSSGIATDITEDVIREMALPMNLVDIKVCAVDETWSGLKLVIRKALRPAAARKRR